MQEQGQHQASDALSVLSSFSPYQWLVSAHHLLNDVVLNAAVGLPQPGQTEQETARFCFWTNLDVASFSIVRLWGHEILVS